jgi:hypothetical protein
MKMRKVAVMLGAMTMLAAAMQTRANTIVYSEDFNAPGFLGSDLNLYGNDINSERWGSDTAYYSINNADYWTFSGGTYLAVNTTTHDQGVLLNENGGIANTLVGLTPNAFYTLSFNYSGDNRPGQNYGFVVDVNSDPVVILSGLSWITLNPAGNQETVEVQANAAGAVALEFYQTTPNGSQASPIIDNVTLSTPDGGMTAGLLGGAMLGLQVIRRKLFC